MLVGLVGKPNVGKSTFFSAATLAPAEIANYPFTTIEPNRGVAFVRLPCPHVAFGLPACTPRTGLCQGGTRFVAVELLDVAGLVKGAHAGRGLGNKFLDDLRQASALIHVVDASGGTDAEGAPVKAGTHDPVEDISFLEEEIDQWIAGIIRKGFDRDAKSVEMKGDRVDDVIVKRLTGLGLTENQVIAAVNKSIVDPLHPTTWKDPDYLDLARNIREMSKPILVAANKSDLAIDGVTERLAKLGRPVIATSAESELALRRAAEKNVIRYTPGSGSFEIPEAEKLNPSQRKALEYIQTHVLSRLGSTGIQRAIEDTVYHLLDRIAVFPVEDETHLTDKEGRILPDAHLVPKGTTARELAYKVHTELGEKFIRAVDAKTRRVIGADHVLQHGDVIRVVAAK
ncbi:MAG: redox-regulated ATPase YchF [Thermoplasmatota archaeon]